MGKSVVLQTFMHNHIFFQCQPCCGSKDFGSGFTVPNLTNPAHVHVYKAGHEAELFEAWNETE